MAGIEPDKMVSSRKRAAVISLAIGGAMLIIKTAAFVITGSAAILSDAMESVVHVVATGMAFYSVIVSARPADRSHPYGHGKIEFFSAGFEGALILIAAVAIVIEVVRGLVTGRQITELDVGIFLTIAAGLVNLFLGFYLVAMGKKHRSLTLVADGKHVLTDSYTSLGVVIGLGLVWWTQWQLFDPAVAILVALNIMVTGFGLIRESIRGLMDETDPPTLRRIVTAINEARKCSWIDVHHLRTFKSGQMLHVDFHLTVPCYWEIQTGHEAENQLSEVVSRAFHGQAETFVHIDPCVPACCHFCNVEDCPVRSEPFAHRDDLTMDHVVEAAGYLIVPPVAPWETHP